jgi:hypothetical protein
MNVLMTSSSVPLSELEMCARQQHAIMLIIVQHIQNSQSSDDVSSHAFDKDLNLLQMRFSRLLQWLYAVGCMFEHCMCFKASFQIQNKSIYKIKNNWISQGINISRKHKRSLCMYMRCVQKVPEICK